MTQEEKTKIEERIVDVLKTVYDPEIPVNIYDLGLIYRIEVGDEGNVDLMSIGGCLNVFFRCIFRAKQQNTQKIRIFLFFFGGVNIIL